MAAWTTVTWSAGDEVTAEKMQNMSDNDLYLKDLMAITRNTYSKSNVVYDAGTGIGPVPSGRTQGSSPSKYVEAIQFTFDSVNEVASFAVNVPLRQAFTEPPICTVSVYSVFRDLHARITSNEDTDVLQVTVTPNLGIVGTDIRCVGVLNVIAVGV